MFLSLGPFRAWLRWKRWLTPPMFPLRKFTVKNGLSLNEFNDGSVAPLGNGLRTIVRSPLGNGLRTIVRSYSSTRSGPSISSFYKKYTPKHNSLKPDLDINCHKKLLNDPLLDMRWVSHFSDDYSLQDEEKMQINLFFLKLFQDIMKADEWDSPSYLPEAYKELAEYLLQEQVLGKAIKPPQKEASFSSVSSERSENADGFELFEKQLQEGAPWRLLEKCTISHPDSHPIQDEKDATSGLVPSTLSGSIQQDQQETSGLKLLISYSEMIGFIEAIDYAHLCRINEVLGSSLFRKENLLKTKYQYRDDVYNILSEFKSVLDGRLATATYDIKSRLELDKFSEEVQSEIEKLTISFDEDFLYQRQPGLLKLFISDDKPSAKDYLRSLLQVDLNPHSVFLY